MSKHVRIYSRSSDISNSSSSIAIPPATNFRQRDYRSLEIRRQLRTDREFLNASLPLERNKHDIRSDRDSSIWSMKSYRTSVTTQKAELEKAESNGRQTTPLDTVRNIPIVQWQKISAVPDTGRIDESFHSSEPVDLKKCLTCKEERSILKLLPCLHSFCQQCLELRIKENPSRSWFRCDLCKKQIHIPGKGIAGFEDNRYFDFSEHSVTENDRCDKCKSRVPNCKCSECKCNLCPDCVHSHLNEDISKPHYIINLKQEMLGKASMSAVCEEHSPFTLELFCLTCSEAICGRCAIDKHINHIAENIVNTARDRRNELKSLLTDSTTRRAIRDAHEYTRTCIKEKENIQADVQATVDAIQVHIKALKDELDELGKTMITDVIEKEVSLTGILERNIEDAEMREKASFASIETLKQIINRTRDLELIGKANNLKSVISEVKKSCKPPPAKCVRIKYKPLVHSLQSSIGRVHMDAFLKRPVHYVELSCLQLGKYISCIHPVDDLKAWVGFRKYVQLCTKDGALGVRIDTGEQVYGMASNSNATVFIACKTSIKVITSKLVAKTLFQLPHEPSDLKMNERDFFIISFKDAKRVALFDTKGKAVQDFDIRHFGFRFGIRINDPWKIAINETQNVYLTDFSSESIGVFDSQCEIKSAFETNVSKHAALCCDRGLLFIADYRHDCVQVYSQEGQLLQTCRIQGIIAPCCIAVDKVGDLWIGSWNGLVKVYSPR